LRKKDKYPYLSNNDVKTTKWQKLKPVEPYYFFVPKDFALQAEYEKFWKVTEIFKEWSFGVTTSRDHFVVGFTKEEIIQKLRIFTGNLPDELVKEGLNLKDTGTWQLSEARQKIKGQHLEEKIYPYAYRPFDNRWICYDPALIERDRYNVMKHMLVGDNEGIAITRGVRDPIPWSHIYSSCSITDKNIIAIKDNSYFFPLNLCKKKESEGRSSRSKVMMLFEPGVDYETKESNFSPAFIKALTDCCKRELSPEEIFNYIYAVLYSPTYRKRYEEFLKIDFPRIPLPSNYKVFKELSTLGKELVEIHLLKSSALDKTKVGFPKSDSNIVEKVSYNEENQSVFVNKEQYFKDISKEVWEYRIGAYQVMQKYLKDRKKRKLSLDEINHYMKVAKAIKLTIELQEKIDKVYEKI